MEFIHEPVLLQEVLEWMDVKPDGVYCDGTLGGGGHSGAMLRLSGGTATLYGIDRDMTAIEAATARLREFPGFHALHGNFHDGKALLMAAGAPKLDGVLLDLGVSSPQLDRGERGFSYHEDAPLDMRMDVSQGQTAADLLNSASEQELCRIIRDYGEEKWAARRSRWRRRSTLCTRWTRRFPRRFAARTTATPRAARSKPSALPSTMSLTRWTRQFATSWTA